MSGYIPIAASTSAWRKPFSANRCASAVLPRPPQARVVAARQDRVHRTVMWRQRHTRHQPLPNPVQQPETTQQENGDSGQGNQRRMTRTRQHPVGDLHHGHRRD